MVFLLLESADCKVLLWKLGSVEADRSALDRFAKLIGALLQMSSRLRRSIKEPDRTGFSYDEIWHGTDKALIRCWEVGRQLRNKDPAIAALAEKGELVCLHWKGGTSTLEEFDAGKKPPLRYGTLRYLATWQGLRGEDLDIEIESQITLVCTRTKRPVLFDLNTTASLEE